MWQICKKRKIRKGAKPFSKHCTCNNKSYLSSFKCLKLYYTLFLFAVWYSVGLIMIAHLKSLAFQEVFVDKHVLWA